MQTLLFNDVPNTVTVKFKVREIQVNWCALIHRFRGRSANSCKIRVLFACAKEDADHSKCTALVLMYEMAFQIYFSNVLAGPSPLPE